MSAKPGTPDDGALPHAVEAPRAHRGPSRSAGRRRSSLGCLGGLGLLLLIGWVLTGRLDRAWGHSFRHLAAGADVIVFARQTSGPVSLPWATYDVLSVARGDVAPGDTLLVAGRGRLAWNNDDFFGADLPAKSGRLVLLFLRSQLGGLAHTSAGQGSVVHWEYIQHARRQSSDDVMGQTLGALTELGGLSELQGEARLLAERDWMRACLTRPALVTRSLADLHRNARAVRHDLCTCPDDDPDAADLRSTWTSTDHELLLSILADRRAYQRNREHAALLLVDVPDRRIDVLLATELADRARCADRGGDTRDQVQTLGGQLFPGDEPFSDSLAAHSEALLWVAAARVGSQSAQQMAEELAGLRYSDARRLALFEECLDELGLASTARATDVVPSPVVSEPARR